MAERNDSQVVAKVNEGNERSRPRADSDMNAEKLMEDVE